MKHDIGHQAAAEQRAGYAAGLRGEPRPNNSKGRAYYNGWINGNVDREEIAAIAAEKAKQANGTV